MTAEKKRDRPGLLKWVLLVLCVTVLAFLCSRYLVQIMLIQGNSMQPAYHHLQPVLLDKLGESYTYGNVIAFSQDIDGRRHVLVKRVVALPGDTVQIRDGTLYVNDTPSDLFGEGGVFAQAGIAAQPIRLEADAYFVIGDNLAESKDSRSAEIGPVSAAQILGRVIGS